jgi:mannose/fructose/N-acetylgalactosamine-specific phosphotransferase system component IID
MVLLSEEKTENERSIQNYQQILNEIVISLLYFIRIFIIYWLLNFYLAIVAEEKQKYKPKK